MFLTYLLQQAYTFADAMVLGKCVSGEALAAIGCCFAITNITVCIAQGLSSGGAVLIGRFFGACEWSRLRRMIRYMLAAAVFLGIILGVTGFFFSGGILKLLETPEDSFGMAKTYLMIYCLGLPFAFVYNVIAAFYNALGKAVYPLLFLILSAVLNIGIDLFLCWF